MHSSIDTHWELINFGRFIELCYPFMDDLDHFLSECNTQQKRLLSAGSSLTKNNIPLLCVFNEEYSSPTVQSQKKVSKKIAPIHIQSASDITSHQQTEVFFLSHFLSTTTIPKHDSTLVHFFSRMINKH
jgi:hypothetical protein